MREPVEEMDIVADNRTSYRLEGAAATGDWKVGNRVGRKEL